MHTDKEATLTLSFDCQKNLVLPKVPDQAAYYSRQFYLYNFTICEGTSKGTQQQDQVFIYTWTEADSHKGSNEIASCVYHQLTNTDMSKYEIVRLFADGCGGQNKNSTMIGMLMKWLSVAPNNIREVQLFFPIPGHSFIPPDRVFGRIEKELLTMNTIITPEDYYAVFLKHGKTMKIGEDFQVFDWKTATGDVLMKPAQWHFKFAISKRFIITRGKVPSAPVLVRGESAYNLDTGMAKKVCKRNKTVRDIIPSMIRRGIAVKQTKINDVKKLLQLHFGEGWEDIPYLKFYKDIIYCGTFREEEDSDDENAGGPMEDLGDTV